MTGRAVTVVIISDKTWPPGVNPHTATRAPSIDRRNVCLFTTLSYCGQVNSQLSSLVGTVRSFQPKPPLVNYHARASFVLVASSFHLGNVIEPADNVGRSE